MRTVGTEPDLRVRIRRAQGKAIRLRRKQLGMSISDLAARLDVTPGAVSQWETGRFSPRSHHQVAIAESLDANWSDIFGLDDENRRRQVIDV
jgi:transcriptional regulator with XRE-family HTH domain